MSECNHNWIPMGEDEYDLSYWMCFKCGAIDEVDD